MRRSDLAFIGLALLGLGLSYAVSSPREVAAREVVNVERLTHPRVTRQAMLGSGETLAGLLLRLGIPLDETGEWVSAARPLADLRSLPVGLEARAETDHHGNLRSVELVPDWSHTVILERTDRGVTGRREAAVVEHRLHSLEGTVETSLFDAVLRAGGSDTLALDLADVFQWDIDFHREVQPGDTFSLLVEDVVAGGERVAYGPLVAASYTSGGRRHVAIRYRAGDHAWGYYDEKGRPLRKQFLRAPLKFGRLTSRYSSSRLHPVLGRRMPHWGVDYAAPSGTPIHATASGTVSFRGWKKGGGNTVELRHANGYSTSYMHMSRFARGVGVGARVEQGDVIGYVGATGLATGPHVDYRITRAGKHINPLTVGNDPAPPLSASEMGAFDRWAGDVLPLLTAPGPVVDAAGEKIAAYLRGSS